jgi:hypothetical protein
MNTETSEQNVLPKDPPPPEETLRQQLDIQWRDHIQTREQTWKALQVVAGLFIGYIGAAYKVPEPAFIRTGGFVVIVAACFGIAITIHHRKVQHNKQTFIYRLEGKLKLHRDDILDKERVKEPKPFRWIDSFDFRHMATPTFILWMHLALLALAAVYMWARG